MVFSSIPLYLDPFNWQQQQQGGGNHETSHLQPSVQPTQVLGGVGGGTATSIGPNSTAERARVAKITQPEAPLKCPRCESTNTKFCYFNNYSLSQPRHFCRTCRRYWTRGGTLRNVPVGGGCRRNNKRSKNDRLKPPVTATTPTADRKQQEGLAASSSTAGSSIIELVGGHFLQPTPQLSFVDSLQNLTQLGVGKSGSNFEGMIQPEVPNFSMVNNTISGASQQFPFLGGGFEVPLSTYPFQNASFTEASWTSYGAGSVHNGINMRSRTTSSTGLVSHLEPLKMEENQGLRDSKQLVGTPENNQSWVSASNATVWTDISGLNSSSCTSHIL